MAAIKRKLKRNAGNHKIRNKVKSPRAVPYQHSILPQARSHYHAGRFARTEAIDPQICSEKTINPGALHYEGMSTPQTGKSAIAIEPVASSITWGPEYVNAYNTAGLTLNGLGRLDEAVANFRLAISLKPDFAEAYYNLGYALYDQGKLDEAAANFRQTISLKADYINAYNTLGLILNDLGRLDEAVANFRLAIGLKPDFVEALYNLGISLHNQGKLDEAVASFKQAISLRPTYTEAYYNLGITLYDKGKLNEAVVYFKKTLNLQPAYPEALNNLGIILHDQGKIEEAIANFRQAISLKPDYAEAYNNLGNALNKMNELQEALSSFHQAISLNPSYHEAHYNLGFVFSQFGKKDDAASCFRKALLLKPDYVQAFTGLSTIVRFAEVENVIMTMEDLYDRKGDLPDADRIELGFALGKVFADLQDYEKSFDFIRRANLLKRGSYEYSTQNDHDLFEEIKKIFVPEFFAAHHDSGCQDETPIFILGMPRSGTTLVEQILASHPLIYGAGEIDVLEEITVDTCTERGTIQFPECLRDLSDDVFEIMGVRYIEKIREYAKDAKYITNKLPHNFLRVGLIKMILPNAKVIHCVRDPMDTCFSIFKHDFKGGGHSYAYDLGELGRYYNLYNDLMAHWNKVLPGFMYNLRYEELVLDQQNQTKSLLDFCDLPWDEACLDFHKATRKVITASLSQVREPIYKDSIALWQQYEKQLGPLRKTLYI